MLHVWLDRTLLARRDPGAEEEAEPEPPSTTRAAAVTALRAGAVLVTLGCVLRATASAEIPSVAARRMILSSTSVTLRTKRTSNPEARKWRTMTSKATNLRACPTWQMS